MISVTRPSMTADSGTWSPVASKSVSRMSTMRSTMIPTLQETFVQLKESGMGLSYDQEHAVWWSLSLGACLGGNGSLIGASANLIVAGFAERAGHPIRFMTFLKTAFPMMLMSVAIAAVYLWMRYL